MEWSNMTTFIDGPAKGQNLMLRRGLIFLRVVYDKQSKKWDALNDIGDTPKDSETLYSYVLIGEANWCHVNIAGGKGGMFVMGEYSLTKPQPTDEIMRDQSKWEEWVEANKHLYASS